MAGAAIRVIMVPDPPLRLRLTSQLILPKVAEMRGEVVATMALAADFLTMMAAIIKHGAVATIIVLRLENGTSQLANSTLRSDGAHVKAANLGRTTGPLEDQPCPEPGVVLRTEVVLDKIAVVSTILPTMLAHGSPGVQTTTKARTRTRTGRTLDRALGLIVVTMKIMEDGTVVVPQRTTTAGVGADGETLILRTTTGPEQHGKILQLPRVPRGQELVLETGESLLSLPGTGPQFLR